jgi:hypothetical protein
LAVVALSEVTDDVNTEPNDQLPADLDLTTLELPYLFPNNNRRRLAGVLYLAVAAVFILVWAVAGNSPLSNNGFLVGAIGVALLGVYSFVSGHDLDVDEVDALAIAGHELGFPVGHASAQLAWRGWSSRPTWRILVYSHEPQPERRALVFVDGVNGEVLESIVEDNPEDWSQYDL